MNIDLITKLVKLANNNPNDNEANLAARKVCKMIEDAKFNFINDVIVNKTTYNGTINSKDAFNDLMNIMRDLNKNSGWDF